MARISDISSFYDFIGYVVLCAPNRFPIRDYLAHEEQMSLEKAFIEIRQGIDLIGAELADELKRPQLFELLESSYRAYQAGDELMGAHLLQDFESALFRRKPPSESQK